MQRLFFDGFRAVLQAGTVALALTIGCERVVYRSPATDASQYTDAAACDLDPRPCTKASECATDAGGHDGDECVAVCEHSTCVAVPLFTRRIEAEEGTVGSPYVVAFDPLASAGAYIVPLDVVDTNTPSTEVSLQVQIPRSGEYFLWVRLYGLARLKDAVFIGVDGREYARVFPQDLYGEYVWTTTLDRPLSYQLTAGSHDFTIGHAEPEVRVDAILVTNDPWLVPQ